MILDTCAILWLAHDLSHFSMETLDKINNSPVVYVSPISGFEIALKWNQGKLKLPMEPGLWFSKVIKHHNLEIIDLSSDICIKAPLLPRIHKDPADRFIIASALHHSMTVVTADERFEEYGVNVIL